MGRISVHFQMGEHPCSRDFDRSAGFDTRQVTGSRPERGCFCKIDTPTNQASVLFSTPEVTRRAIMARRKEFATQIAEMIVDGLGREDTLDGYPKG